MMDFVDAKPINMLDFWVVRITLVLMAAFCAWLVFDTKHALERMIRLSERLSPFPSFWKVNTEKAGWIWFYRIDAAVVLLGIVQMFIQHYTR